MKHAKTFAEWYRAFLRMISRNKNSWDRSVPPCIKCSDEQICYCALTSYECKKFVSYVSREYTI